MKPAAVVVPFLLLAIVQCKRDHNTERRDRGRHTGGRRAVRDQESQKIGQCELEISCKGDPTISSPVKLPIKGPRGPQGRAGEKGASGEAGIPGKAGLPGKSAKSIPQIAFFVGLGNNSSPIEENTDLVFDRVITNIGGAYNEETGRFTAPISGVYHFTVVVAAQGRQKAAVMLMKEGKMVETIWAESIPYWATSSNTAILDLKAGQQVWLVLLKRAPYIHGYMYSSFSGYSLFSTEEDVEENGEEDDDADDEEDDTLS